MNTISRSKRRGVGNSGKVRNETEFRKTQTLMKKRLCWFFFSLPLLTPVLTVRSQSIEVRPYAGYTFRESFPIRSGDVRIKEAGTYGVTASVILKEILDVNLSYQWQPTKMDIITVNEDDRDVSITVSYIQAGFNRNFIVSDKFIPYTGLRLGAAILTDHSGRYSKATKFGVGLNAGAKYYFSKNIGAQLYALLQSPIQGAGVFLGIGTGGVSSGVGTYTYIIQLSFGAGLVIKLK